jgi:hypothetical protein
MRRARHIHPEELMNPDLLSEILITGSVLLAVAVSWFALLRASGLAACCNSRTRRNHTNLEPLDKPTRA